MSGTCAFGTPLEAGKPCRKCGATTRDVCGPHYAKVCSDREALREALEGLELFFVRPGENSIDKFERIAAAFRRDTGKLAPGKDAPSANPDAAATHAEFDAWADSKAEAARAALRSAKGE